SRSPTPAKVAPRRTPAPHSQLELPRTRSWTARLSVVLRSSLAVLHLWTAAYAGEVENEVRALLEEYRSAHVAKNLDRLAAVYVAFPPHQREATNAYLQN